MTPPLRKQRAGLGGSHQVSEAIHHSDLRHASRGAESNVATAQQSIRYKNALPGKVTDEGRATLQNLSDAIPGIAISGVSGPTVAPWTLGAVGHGAPERDLPFPQPPASHHSRRLPLVHRELPVHQHPPHPLAQ